MSLRKYEAFLKTVELGSLSKAAEALGYTQSGISHILNSLEKEWGIVLLLRDRSGVRMTSEATQLYPLIQNVCKADTDLLNAIGELSGLKFGLIRIGSFTSVSVHWLPKIIREFKTLYPHVDFEILHGHYQEIEHWITEGRVDFGFLNLPARIDAESIYWMRDRLVAVLPEDHPYADCEVFPIERFRVEPFILLEIGPVNEVTDLLKDYGVFPKVQYSAKDDYTVISMVENGLGISVLHEMVLHRNPFNVVVKPLDQPASRDLGIVLRGHDTASSAAKQFIAFAVEYIKTHSLHPVSGQDQIKE